MKGAPQPTLDAAQKAGAVTLNIGDFLNAVIQFVIIAFAIFWVVKVISRFERREAPPPPRTEVLLQEVRDALVARPPSGTPL